VALRARTECRTIGFDMAMGRRWVRYGLEEGFGHRARTEVTTVE
jgi:hypothetical protein